MRGGGQPVISPRGALLLRLRIGGRLNEFRGTQFRVMVTGRWPRVIIAMSAVPVRPLHPAKPGPATRMPTSPRCSATGRGMPLNCRSSSWCGHPPPRYFLIWRRHWW